MPGEMCTKTARLLSERDIHEDLHRDINEDDDTSGDSGSDGGSEKDMGGDTESDLSENSRLLRVNRDDLELAKWRKLAGIDQ